MTAALRSDRRPNAGSQPAAHPRSRPRVGHPTRHPNRSRVALGLLVIVLSVLGVAAVAARGGQSRSVLAVASEIPAGASIKATDLVTVELPADSNLPAVDADRVGELVGQAATTTLYRGTLLIPAHVAAEARVPEGTVLAGAVLDPGQYPVDLRIGDRVTLIKSAPLSSVNDQPGTERLGLGEVRQISEPPIGTGALVVSLAVAQASADAVAAAGAQGQLSLVVVGAR